MASPNVLIENEDNAMLPHYAKEIGLAMKGITISICEKSHCKNNDNIGKKILNGLINNSWHLLHVKMTGGVFWAIFVCNTFT